MPLEIRYPSPLEETEIQSIARAIFDQPDDDLDFEHDELSRSRGHEGRYLSLTPVFLELSR